MARFSSFALCVLLLTLAAMAGCLEFDEQTIYVEHDEANDRLLLIIDYQGLYETNGHGSAQEDLEEILRAKTVALWSSWPFSVSLDQLRTDLQEMAAEESPDLPEPVRLDCLKLLDRVRVLNAGFYTDAAGRPCASQVVIIEKIGDTLPLANRTLNTAIREQAAHESESQPMQMCRAAAAADHTWLVLKGHALIAEVPLPESEFEEARAGLRDELRQDNEVVRRVVNALLSQPVLFWHEDSMLRVKVGLQAQPSQLAMPSKGDYKPNLAEHIAKTYGLHLDDMLARYLLDPEARAETEQETAARMMAPRLSQRALLRVLTRSLRKAPSEVLRDKLRALDQTLSEGKTDEELLAHWEQWLREQAAAPSKETDEEPAEAAAEAEEAE